MDIIYVCRGVEVCLCKWDDLDRVTCAQARISLTEFLYLNGDLDVCFILCTG